MPELNYESVVEITREDAKQSCLLVLEEVGFPATSWAPFDIAPLTVELAADNRVNTSKVAVTLKKSFMSSTAVGTALSELSKSFYDNLREPAVETQILVTLECDATNGPHQIELGELTFDHANGSTYRNVEGNSIVYPVNLNTSDSLQLLVEAEVAGTAANIANAGAPEDVTLNLVTSLAGVTITAHEIERSGLEEESDDRLTERDQLKWSLLSRVSLLDEAIEAEALRVAPAVLSVAVDSSNPRGVQTFDVYCAGLDATSSADDVSLVQIAIDRLTFGRKNTPKTCMVYPAPEEVLDITALVYVIGVSTVTAAVLVEEALTEFIRNIPPGGLDYSPGPSGIVAKNDLESVIRETLKDNGASKVTVEMSEPTANVYVVDYGKVIRGTWNITYTTVSA